MSVGWIVRGYAVAFAASGFTAVLRLVLHPRLGETPVFLLFVPAVAISAAVGGVGPALTATAVSVAAILLLTGPHILGVCLSELVRMALLAGF